VSARETAAGSIDWSATMELLRSRPGQYPLLLELRDDPALHYGLDHVARAFDQLEALESTKAESTNA